VAPPKQKRDPRRLSPSARSICALIGPACVTCLVTGAVAVFVTNDAAGSGIIAATGSPVASAKVGSAKTDFAKSVAVSSRDVGGNVIDVDALFLRQRPPRSYMGHFNSHDANVNGLRANGNLGIF